MSSSLAKLRAVHDQTLAWLLQRENYPKSFTDWYLILFQCQNCGAEGQGRIDMQGTLWTYGGCVSTSRMVDEEGHTYGNIGNHQRRHGYQVVHSWA